MVCGVICTNGLVMCVVYHVFMWYVVMCMCSLLFCLEVVYCYINKCYVVTCSTSMLCV